MRSSTVLTSVRRLRLLLAGQHGQEQSDEQLLNAFIDRRDDLAFAALVHRHGPMVLAVCRRVLGHEQDAEDAFQAAFLVLARQAASLRDKNAVAGFLYGAAFHLASKAKRAAGRRRKHEGERGRVSAPSERTLGALTRPRSPVDPTDELCWREVRLILDEEIARLPDRCRSVFIFCCLEELSQAETGRRLGLKECTVHSRLAEARKSLGQRLTQRGVELTAVLAASTLAALPAELMASTIEAALATAAGGGLAGIVSASVAELVGGMAQATMLSKMKMATLILLAATVLGGTGVWFAESPIDKEPGERRGVSPPVFASTGGLTPRRSPQKESDLEIHGQVLNPDGKPVRGVKLLFLWWFEELPAKIWATSGADGRFAFAVAHSPAANSGWQMPGREQPYVLAAAEGYGFAVVQLDNLDAPGDLTLRLVKDDVPIRGRVIDLQGRPIAGVRVRISDDKIRRRNRLCVPKRGELTAWLAALKDSKRNPWELEQTYLTSLESPSFDLLFPPVTTRADGRFEMRGIGRERLAYLRLEGPTIATQIVTVMTRSGKTIRIPWNRAFPKEYHGADCEILAAPTKPVVGVVRDRDSGKPLAGVTIWPNKITNPFDISNFNGRLIQTKTDQDGRYRLVGLPKGDDNQLLATTDDLPYLPLSKKVENTPELGPVTVDFALKRGIWVKGRVTEKGTGKPLRGGIGYYCFRDNPNVKEIPHVLGSTDRMIRKDGSFQLVAVPGHGLIALYLNNHYLDGDGAKKIKGPRWEIAGMEVFATAPNWIAVERNPVEINPRPDDESIACDLIAVPYRTLKGTVWGPDGKPLAGARRQGGETLLGSEFTIELRHGKLREPWEVEFVHEDKKLAGFVTVHGDEKGPLQVRLQPWGVLTGRLVTAEGEPLTGVEVSCDAGEDRPDKQGRFRIEGLTPGKKYKKIWIGKESRILHLIGAEPKNLTVQPGEAKDLGVLKVKSKE